MGPFFVRTGQAWKVWIATALLWATLGLMAVRWLVIGRHRLEAASMVLGAAWIAWTWFMLWCPRCGSAVIWQIVSRRPIGAALKEIFEVRACPACGFRGEEGPAAR